MKKYLSVDAENIIMIDYWFSDQSFYGSFNSYPKPQTMVSCGDNSISIFERNNVPQDYQRIFIETNSISQTLCLPSSAIIRKKNALHRFEGREFITEMPINLSVSQYDEIYGYMASEKPAFDVRSCYDVEKNEVIRFFGELRKDGLFDNYLKALGEIEHIEIKSDIDSNKVKIKENKNS